MRKLITIIASLILLTTVNFANVDIDMTKDYTADEIENTAWQLEAAYPDSIEVEVVGQSVLGKNILAVRAHSSKKDYTKRYEDDNVSVLLTAGVHGREPTNPKLVLKQLQYYVENNLIPENVSIHVLPMVNPDGFDLSLQGPMNEKSKEILSDMGDKNYPRWKANINGVDINRNFPDEFYDKETQEWVNSWGRQDDPIYTSRGPGGSYYFGDEAGSEPETQAVMNYMQRYYFDGFIDYHSQGNVIYWRKWYLDDKYNQTVTNMAKAMRDYANNYMLMPATDSHGSGYTTNYFTNLYYERPSFTVETTRTRTLPKVSNAQEKDAFERNKNTTLVMVEHFLLNKEYGEYKAYTEDYQFFNHFEDEDVALAYADKYDLKVFKYLGAPKADFTWYATILKEITKFEKLGFNSVLKTILAFRPVA